MCRLWATEVSEIKPQLDAHGVGLAGVGLEKLGVDDFVEGGYFKGDLYLDEGKAIYSQMQFKRYNMLSIGGALVSSETRKANARSNARGIKGNMKGDGMQLGGTLVVSKGGEKVLLCHKQKNPGDHTNVTAVLQSLGIATSGDEGEGATAAVQGENTSETKAEEAKKDEDESGKTENDVKGAGDAVKGEASEGKDKANDGETKIDACKSCANAEEPKSGAKEDGPKDEETKPVDNAAQEDAAAKVESSIKESSTREDAVEDKAGNAVDAVEDNASKGDNVVEETANKDATEGDVKKEETVEDVDKSKEEEVKDSAPKEENAEENKNE